MNESQMKTLVATVDAGSMTKAAKALYLTTPALMQRIKSLEAELGFSLLIRSKLGVSPTKDGKRMYEAFKAALTILDEAKNGGGSAADRERIINLGVWWRIPPSFREALEQLGPETTPYVNCLSLTPDEIPEYFEKDIIDVYVGTRSFALEESGLKFTPLGFQQDYLLFAPETGFGKISDISTDALAPYRIYAGSDYRDIPEYREVEQVKKLFAADNVIKESIFPEKLFQDCLQGRAVAFFRVRIAPTQVDFADIPKGLELRPMNWPSIAHGIYAKPHAPTFIHKFTNQVARATA